MSVDITIVGLGPGPALLRTTAVQKALDGAAHLFVRSHGDVDLSDLLGQPRVTDLAQYRKTFDANRWTEAAEVVIKSAVEQPVVLAVPGHPRFGEGLVRHVVRMAAERNLTTAVIDGLSATDMLASALNIDPILDRVQLVSARELVRIDKQRPFAGGLLGLSARRPVLITHAYTSEILATIQRQLRRILPDTHPVTLITAAGLPEQVIEATTVEHLHEYPGGDLVAIYIPPLGELTATRTPDTLQHIVARLRREDGCPWDREQTNLSLATSLVDEVYEAVDAIHANDDVNLAEELGDILLLIMMHAQIAEERGAFTLEDVYHGVITKIVRRHPHVFGDISIETADDTLALWQLIKQQEKSAGVQKPEKAADGQPHSMPALERATRILSKHPLPASSSSVEEREQALLRALSAIIAAGDDPDTVLKTVLTRHVTGLTMSLVQGEDHASH